MAPKIIIPYILNAFSIVNKLSLGIWKVSFVTGAENAIKNNDSILLK